MILVRLVFQAKFGKGGELAAGFKASEQAFTSQMRGRNFRLMTDLSGPFDTVVQEMEYESVQAFLDDLERMFAGSGPGDESTRNIGELIRSGSKEYYTIL